MSETNSKDKPQGSTWLGGIQQLYSDAAKGLKEAGQSSVDVGANVLSWSTNMAVTVGQTGAGTVTAAKDGWEKLGAFSADTWEKVSENSGKALQAIHQAPSTFSDLIFRDCPVPLYLLPIGGAPDEFICRFDFKDVTTKLHRGILVRPRIDIWAGRDDLDREQLSRVLQDEFTRQLHEERRKRAIEVQRESTARAQQGQQAPVQPGLDIQSSLKIALSAAQLMLVVTNPVVDLLLLALAIGVSSNAAVAVLKPLFFSSPLEDVEGEIETELRRLEVECDAQSQRFQAAIGQLSVQIHPVLRALTQAFAEVTCEQGPPIMHQEDSLRCPEVTALLLEPGYRQQLPAHMLPILDEHTKPQVLI